MSRPSAASQPSGPGGGSALPRTFGACTGNVAGSFRRLVARLSTATARVHVAAGIDRGLLAACADALRERCYGLPR